MSDHVTKRRRDGKRPLKIVVDTETRALAERLAFERGHRYAGAGNLSALFSVLVHEAVAKGGER